MIVIGTVTRQAHPSDMPSKPVLKPQLRGTDPLNASFGTIASLE
jgi:hypothetical protein